MNAVTYMQFSRLTLKMTAVQAGKVSWGTNMIGDPKTGRLVNCEISAVTFEGFTVKTATGEPATLAVIDKDGNIVEMGATVAHELWSVAILAYRNFLKGEGYLRVRSGPLDGLHLPL